VLGESFKFTVYSSSPIFSVPTGVIRLWSVSALTTSLARDAVGVQRLLIEIGLDLPNLAP